MSQMRTVTIKCAYCNHESAKKVYISFSSFVSGPRLIHGLDGDGYKGAIISECPHCGYTSYDLRQRIPGISSETIEQINKEYEVVKSSIPSENDYSDTSHKIIREYTKYYFLSRKAEYDNIDSKLHDLALCMYHLKSYDFVFNQLLSGFVEEYKKCNHVNISVLDFFRTLGLFSFVSEELKKYTCELTPYLSIVIELEKECCRKQINNSLYNSDIKWIEENGLEETRVKQCSSCGQDLCFEKKDFFAPCDKCGKMDERSSKYYPKDAPTIIQ